MAAVVTTDMYVNLYAVIALFSTEVLICLGAVIKDYNFLNEYKRFGVYKKYVI